jgi:hypothetical protein
MPKSINVEFCFISSCFAGNKLQNRNTALAEDGCPEGRPLPLEAKVATGGPLVPCSRFSLIPPIKTFDCRSRYLQLPYSCIANLAPPPPFEEIHVERITQLSDA